MSLPSFPVVNPPIEREDAVNQILSSIAMEELGLSHILNAEGEKLQYILGTLPGLSGPPATVSDVLAANESVRSMLETAAQNQLFLKAKMQGALTASPMQAVVRERREVCRREKRNGVCRQYSPCPSDSRLLQCTRSVGCGYRQQNACFGA